MTRSSRPFVALPIACRVCLVGAKRASVLYVVCPAPSTVLVGVQNILVGGIILNSL